jgi:hypothetical protein
LVSLIDLNCITQCLKRKESPIGRRMSSAGIGVAIPTSPSMAANESFRKFQYLNTASTEQLATMLAPSHTRRFVPLDRSIPRPAQ